MSGRERILDPITGPKPEQHPDHQPEPKPPRAPTAFAPVWHGDPELCPLRRQAQDHGQHRGAAGHREDPLAPRAHGSAAASARAAARRAGVTGFLRATATAARS